MIETISYKKSQKVMKFGAIGLALFVAIPLPITGAWTGSVAAILFDIKPRYAFPAIILGVTIAGIIVTCITYYPWLFLPFIFSLIIISCILYFKNAKQV